MTIQEVKKDAFVGLDVLQQAVYEELEKKAKLGQSAVVSGANGEPRVILAKDLIKEMKKEK